MRFGVISGLDESYTSNGELMSVSDLRSVEFNARTLTQIDSQVTQLISVLNQFGHQNFGNDLHLGYLRIETEPEVQYLAPIFARGMTDQWTLGFGIPIVRYSNRISLRHFGSNVEQLQQAYSGAHPQIDQAFQQLNVDVGQSLQSELRRKGYKPIEDRDENLMGDLQLVSLYRLPTRMSVKPLAKTIFNLPTGAKNDPDDLIDLGTFGQPAIEQQFISSYAPLSWANITGKLGYRWNLPDTIEKRVPVNDADLLPDQTRKENLKRDTGDVKTVGIITNLFWNKWNLGTGYEYNQKNEDSFEGDRGWNYNLLSEDTASEWLKFRIGLSYSTVKSYLAQQSIAPFILDYEFSDIVQGRNTERQQLHEFSMTLFF